MRFGEGKQEVSPLGVVGCPGDAARVSSSNIFTIQLFLKLFPKESSAVPTARPPKFVKPIILDSSWSGGEALLHMMTEVVQASCRLYKRQKVIDWMLPTFESSRILLVFSMGFLLRWTC